MKKNKLMKLRQILALAGVVIIALLYVATLICAFIDRSQSKSLLMASLFVTFFVAFVLYAFTLLLKLGHKDEEKENEEK